MRDDNQRFATMENYNQAAQEQNQPTMWKLNNNQKNDDLTVEEVREAE